MTTDHAGDERRDQDVTNAPPSRTALRVRQPTGNVAYPLVLVEGDEKAGKTFSLAQLSNSPRVGRTFVAELGERRLDEYASLGRFELLDHNGTYGGLLEQLSAACAEPQDAERPNVVGLDTGSSLWNLLADWTDHRARNSRKARELLARDPDAEVTRGMNLWNDARQRWHRVIRLLADFPGIAVVTARGRDVAVIGPNGEPTGAREWKVEAEKNLQHDVDAWVRVRRGEQPRLIAIASLHVEVPRGGLELPRTDTLDHLLFDVLSAGGKFAPARPNVPVIGLPAAAAKGRLLAYLEPLIPDEAHRKNVAGAAWKSAGLEGAKEVTEAEYQLALDAARPAGPNDVQPPDAAPDATTPKGEGWDDDGQAPPGAANGAGAADPELEAPFVEKPSVDPAAAEPNDASKPKAKRATKATKAAT